MDTAIMKIEQYLYGLCGITFVIPEKKKKPCRINYMRQRFRGAIDYKSEHWKGELDALIETGWGQFLVNKQGQGQTLDYLSMEAREEGWLRADEDATPDNFINALHENRKSMEWLEDIDVIEKAAREYYKTPCV